MMMKRCSGSQGYHESWEAFPSFDFAPSDNLRYLRDWIPQPPYSHSIYDTPIAGVHLLYGKPLSYLWPTRNSASRSRFSTADARDALAKVTLEAIRPPKGYHVLADRL